MNLTLEKISPPFLGRALRRPRVRAYPYSSRMRIFCVLLAALRARVHGVYIFSCLAGRSYA